MRYEERRGPWYLFTGVLIGILLGVGYTRYLQPVEYVDTSPASLRQDFKEQYRAMIASAFLANGDLVRASARLELLEDEDAIRALTEQAQQTLAKDGASAEARALGMLAIALGQSAPGPGQAITRAPSLPTGTTALSTPASLLEPGLENTNAAQPADPSQESPVQETPAAGTDSAAPTQAALPTQEVSAGPFVLLSKEEVCDQPLTDPLIQVEVQDINGEPQAGVLVIVNWVGGEERFFTGLKPEKGPGYADYTLNPEFIYSLRVGEDGAPLGNLGAVTCTSTSGTFWGSTLLKFGQP